MRDEQDPWAETDKRDSLGPVGRPASKPLPRYEPTSNAGEPDRRIDAISNLAARYPGANAADREAEKERIKWLVKDTASLPVDVLEMAIAEGVVKWKFMPTAAEIFDAAQEELYHRRTMARLASFPPPAPALPAPPVGPPNDAQLAAMNEWGKPLGFQWDAQGRMTRVEPQRDKARPLEEREAPTAHPQAADYADIAAQILASASPVSDVSPALKAMRDRMLAHNTAKGY